MVNKKIISATITERQFAEFAQIAKKVGFDSPEGLLKNYVREVIIAARTEDATASLKETVLRGSSDLDNLVVERKST